MTFCKIFESEKYGQILVFKDLVDGYPAVSVRFVPKGMGLSGPDIKQTCEDVAEAWEKVGKVFDTMTLREAELLASAVDEVAQGMREEVEG